MSSLSARPTVATLVESISPWFAVLRRWHPVPMGDELKVFEIQLRFWEKGGRLRLRQVEDGLWEGRSSSRRFGGWATTVYGPTRLDAARWALVAYETKLPVGVVNPAAQTGGGTAQRGDRAASDVNM